jgi:hypothetical protein
MGGNISLKNGELDESMSNKFNGADSFTEYFHAH